MGLSLLLLLVNTGLGALASSGKIPQLAAQLVSGLSPIVANAITSIESGSGKLQDAVVALGALSGAIQFIKAQANTDPEVLNLIDNYDKAVQAGINGYIASKDGVDLNALGAVKPIA